MRTQAGHRRNGVMVKAGGIVSDISTPSMYINCFARQSGFPTASNYRLWGSLISCGNK